MNDHIALLHSHRSIRRYRPDPVPEEHVLAAVQAGQAASTSSAIQAYCVLRVTDPAARGKLAELTGPQAKVAECGVFFIVCGDTRRHRLAAERDGLPHDAHLEGFVLAVVDATLFAQNLVVAFESLGYGICYIGGLRNDLPAVHALIGFPQGVYPLYGLCVGVPDEDPTPRPRLPVEAVLFEDSFPDDATVLGHLEAYDAEYRAYVESRRGGPGKPAGAGWSQIMAAKFSEPRRSEIGPFYRGQGADFS